LKFHLWQISSIEDSLRIFNSNVARIGDLHSRSLNNTDDAAAQRNASQLEQLVADTSELSGNLKQRVERQLSRFQRFLSLRQTRLTRNSQIHMSGMVLIKTKFVEAIQNYQKVELQHRTNCQQRIERQFKIGESSSNSALCK
jgi:syntaxin 1B/2/3